MSDNIKVKRRKIYCDTSFTREESKKKRYRGEPYVSDRGVEVSGKKFKLIDCCCLEDCYNKVSVSCQKELFCLFYIGQNKSLQDSYLSRCMCIKEKQPHAKVTSNPTSYRINTWEYMLIIDGTQVKICRVMLCKLFHISVKRIRVVQQKVLNNSSFEEQRGSHLNRPHKIADNVWVMVKEHLNTIPSHKSHYSGNKSSLSYFDNPNMNVKVLFNMFSEYFFEKTCTKLQMSYITYFKYFKKDCDYAFKNPKTDVCDFCASCEVKLQNVPNDVCKSKYILHKRRAEKYLEIKKDFINKCKTDSSYLVIEFDFAQNLPVPKINVTSQFYKRLLWLYAFNVHIHNDNSSFMYCYMEMQAKKNANSVASFVYHTLKQKLQEFTAVKNIILLSDACGGQNKNIVIVSFCSWLAKVHKVEVTHVFPVRGHSFGQCDRNFGLFKRKVKKI